MDIVKETEETDKPATLQSALIDIRDLDLSVSSKIIFCYSVRSSRRSLFMAFISFNPEVFLRKTLLTKSFFSKSANKISLGVSLGVSEILFELLSEAYLKPN